MGGHHDDHSDGEHEHDAEEWIQLLSAEDRREVHELELAKREVERQMIHANQAKLAGKKEALRANHRAGGGGVLGPMGQTQDVMSRLYAEDVDVDRLAALLPKPGEGEKTKQLPFQRLWDGIAGVRFSPWYAVISMLVTLVASCVYVYETTLDSGEDGNGGVGGWTRKSGVYPSWYAPLEDFFLAFFCFDVLMGAVMADHDWGYWLATETIVEVLSLLPSLLFVAFDLRLWGFLRFTRVLRWSDIATVEARRPRYLRLSEMDGTLKGDVDKSKGSFLGIKYEALSAAYRLTAFVLRFILVVAGAAVLLDRTGGGIEHISDDKSNDALSFASAVYMSAMILTTVGEGGDGPVPVSTLARIAATAVLLAFLPLAAIRLSDVVKHSDTSGLLGKGRRSAPAVRERHVVALGSITDANISARLKEIFHVDHGTQNTRWVRAVVVSPNPPTQGIRALLETPVYRGRVSYIQGSPLDDDCLRKARVSESAAVMVLANKLARSSHVEDMNVSLQAISVMTHVELQRRQGWGPRLLVELLDPNAAIHLRAAGVKQVLSSDQLKLSVLAQSCLCPGWSAVVANLLESRAALPPQVLEQGSWLAEYYVGAKKTFYSVEFSPNFAGMFFDDAVVHIFEVFELILVAIESKRAGAGDPVVLVNPSGGYRIGRGDRAFVLAESQADARVLWDYMAKSPMEEFNRASRFMNPEEEEAAALETLGTAGIAGGPQAFVDSMMFTRTLLQCQRKLPEGEAPDPGVIIEWARQFQVTEGLSNLEIVNKVLATSGLTLAPPTEDTAAMYRELGIHPDGGAQDASMSADAESPDEENGASGSASRTADSVPAVGPPLIEIDTADVPTNVVGPCPPEHAGQSRPAEGSRSRVAAAATEAAEDMSVDDIMKTLKTMEVSSLDGKAACERLLHLQAAAEIASQPKTAAPTSSSSGSRSNGRRITSARDWKGHVVVVGFPARPSHLECFLRPLKGWSGGADSEGSGRGVPVVLVAKKVDMLESALEVVEKAGQINTREVYLLEGSPVSHMDLENAGVRSAKVVLVMKDPRRRSILEADNDEDALRDAEALVTFMKMEDGLLTQDQHVVVELESSSNVRFLHTRSEASSLHSIAGLGGAGRGGPADDAHYLWPKYAAGMTYNAAFLDSLFGQAFYRPSRLALIERLLLLDRGDFVDTSQANHSTHRRRRRAASLAQQNEDVEEDAAAEEENGPRVPEMGRMVREASLMQMGVPSTFVGHSFGELFQHLASPPLRCVAFALLRARGTRNAPEPYVYTGPRADTVLHAGDRVFVLGCPPEI